MVVVEIVKDEVVMVVVTGKEDEAAVENIIMDEDMAAVLMVDIILANTVLVMNRQIHRVRRPMV